MSEKLKPCRKCGGEPVRAYDPDEEFGDMPYVYCSKCGCQTLPYFYCDEAVEAWNNWDEIQGAQS